MKRASLLLCAASLAGIAHDTLAGEDSTHRWHGVGPAWYEVEGGLRRFAAGEDYDPLLGRKSPRKPAQKNAQTKAGSGRTSTGP